MRLSKTMLKTSKRNVEQESILDYRAFILKTDANEDPIKRRDKGYGRSHRIPRRERGTSRGHLPRISIKPLLEIRFGL